MLSLLSKISIPAFEFVKIILVYKSLYSKRCCYFGSNYDMGGLTLQYTLAASMMALHRHVTIDCEIDWKVSCQVYGVAWHFKHVTIDWESIVGFMVLPGKKVSLGLWCCLTFHRYVTITCEIDWGIVLASSCLYGVAWRLGIHWNFTITCGIDRESFSAGSFLHGVAWRYNKHVTIDWKSVVRFMVLLGKKSVIRSMVLPGILWTYYHHLWNWLGELSWQVLVFMVLSYTSLKFHHHLWNWLGKCLGRFLPLWRCLAWLLGCII